MRAWAPLASLPLLVASAIAIACPLCVGTAAGSRANQLVSLSEAVLAVTEGGRYRVLEVLKGENAAGWLDNVQVRASIEAGDVVLLSRDADWPSWIVLGAVDPRHAGALRTFAVRRPEQGDFAGWQRRVDLAVRHLNDPDPLLAEIAYVECASAPYATLRGTDARSDIDMMRRSLVDPQLASRRSLYALLLGFSGDASDADAIEAEIEKAWSSHQVADVGSLLAADLELRGPSRVAWVEDRYFRDRSRTPAEIEAALLALSVHGDAQGVISRQRVIEAYRIFMREHPDIAGYVAKDLAAWQYWDATPEFAALMKSGVRQQYASHVAIVAYLVQSPLTAKSK